MLSVHIHTYIQGMSGGKDEGKSTATVVHEKRLGGKNSNQSDTVSHPTGQYSTPLVSTVDLDNCNCNHKLI